MDLICQEEKTDRRLMAERVKISSNKLLVQEFVTVKFGLSRG